MKPFRPWKEVLADWAPDLSQKLGRPESEILEEGLGVTDFLPNCSVEVRYPFGVTHRFAKAFVVVRPASGEAAVFSENAGYAEYALVDDCELAEITEEIYRQKA